MKNYTQNFAFTQLKEQNKKEKNNSNVREKAIYHLVSTIIVDNKSLA